MPKFKKKEVDSGLHLVIRSYKTKLRPTSDQAIMFGKCGDVARFVYNWALADRRDAWEQRAERVTFEEQKRRFNSIKWEQYPWVVDVPYVVVESAFMHLDAAYVNFFRRVGCSGDPGYPEFKRMDAPKRFKFRGAFRVERDRIKLPVIGWVDLAEPDYIPKSPHKIVDVTVSQRANEWFVSVCVQEVRMSPERPEGDPIGVDFGYGVLAVTSEGNRYDNPAVFEKNESKLAKLQRKLSRQKKGSKNREKTKSKIAKLHAKIADTRAHHAHNVSRSIVDGGHSTIAVQKLAVSEMMQDDSPSNRYAERAKRLADAATAELRRQIEYKQQWSGGVVLTGETDHATNRRCSACGHVNESAPISNEEFTCESCMTVHDRRVNGAKNALHFAGLSL